MEHEIINKVRNVKLIQNR